MAVDSFMLFQDYNGTYLDSESQVVFTETKGFADDLGKNFIANPQKCFEIDEFSFDIEQTINMTSQAGGGGAGKVQFGTFKVTRKIDKASAPMFLKACNGTHFQFVNLGFRKAAGADASGIFYLRFDFKLVLLKTISWSHGDDSPTEELELEYGALRVNYLPQMPEGRMGVLQQGSWNKINNVSDASGFDTPIKFLKA